jgi:hypothetical protein
VQPYNPKTATIDHSEKSDAQSDMFPAMEKHKQEGAKSLSDSPKNNVKDEFDELEEPLDN